MERLKDQPFALLAINSDPKEKVKAARERENLTWRMWWDGGNTRGPIATQWGVSFWPTIYVLDDEGRVRYTGVRGEDMDAAVDTLLAELKAKKGQDKNAKPKDGEKRN